MAGIRPPDNATPVAPPELTEEKTVHCLFSVRNMFYSNNW